MESTRQFIDSKQKAQDLYHKGVALYLDGKHHDAVDVLEDAAEHDPNHHQSYAMLAKITLENGYLEEALECYALAINANREETDYKEGFLSLVSRMPVRAFNQAFKEIVLNCLMTDGLDWTMARNPWHGTLQHDPEFLPYYALAEKKDFESFKEGFLELDNPQALVDPFFLIGLQKLLIFDTNFEQFLTYLRRLLLEDQNIITLNETERLALTASLACYAHNTEYVFSEADSEQKTVQTIFEKIENGAPDHQLITMLACYRPLVCLNNSDQIAKNLTGHPVLEYVADIHIKQAQQRENIKKDIKAITPITENISEKVREQYEAFPYPRWQFFDQEIKNETYEGFLEQGMPEILVAGCGTGKEAIELGYVFPDAKILAVDLSQTSLAYAIQKANEFNIENVEFRQADILELGALDKKFDFITSSGVLHHMSEPEKGLSVLESLLKPGGTMRLAFYSESAREAINKARNVISEKQYGADNEAIRKFRADAPLLLNKTAYEGIKRFADYYTLSECRDLLFHVQEHQYDLMRLKELLAKNELQFKGFYLPETVLENYQKAYPHDPVQTNLDDWAEFEQQHPDTFIEMYRFWCQKN